MPVYTFGNQGGGESFGFAQYGAYYSYNPDKPVTLEDILACCAANNTLLQQILDFLRKQGFRRERPTRQELWDQNQRTLNEIRDMKKEVRRRGLDRGIHNA